MANLTILEALNRSLIATKKYVDDKVPYYNETLMFDISGDDYKSLMTNNYFNVNALNIDETKSHIIKVKDPISENIFELKYNKETDALMAEDYQIYVYNHKSYDGTNFVEDTNSAVLTLGITPYGMDSSESHNIYFKLYEVDKVELDNNCLSKDLSIKNSLTVGSRMGDIGEFSVAEGINTIASGYASHAEGINTTASYDCSHAEGESSNSISAVISDFSPSTRDDDILTAWNTNKFSLAKGESSHVEGKDCLALGDNSHAEGAGTTASGEMSHAEGGGTTASGYTSHAEGAGTTASGEASHAEGGNTTASGEASHAEGFLTIASSSYQHVQGKYNTEDTESRYAHIVGNGNSNTRSHAHNLDWQGNAWFKGNVSIDGTPTNDNELVTKKYVDDAIASQPQISFDTEGNLVVTIGGVTKKFKEITE